ncbi:ATP-binding protein [Streptomyces sp. N2-109]|uniref:ATP-binding protein n=1 Tax=Streptomyces gossypii TaxID=2883101 RepID=A0ABT2JVS5_9ACTN|nr:ATP-binding protein [Streptomyces gossypii]MCT2591965.1 ATP-binding protein [Streptomyces gossypii]
MLEVMTLGALTALLAAVGNGAAGEVGRRLLLSTGAQVRRTLGRETPLPATSEGYVRLAHEIHPVLRGDRSRSAEWAALLESLPVSAHTLRPGPGLPPATREFTDRRGVLKELQREATRAAAGRPRVALLHGPPGIGSSAVALHWGADQITRFPGGQFYVDARDAPGERGLEPAAVLSRLLQQMGVEPEHMPPTEAGRERLSRQLVAGSRALIVVDHATSAAQVRALVPATPEVFLLVVSSGPAFGVEARRIAVPPLADRDAREMLKRVAGPDNWRLLKPQTSALLERCAGNTLALKAAASRLLVAEPASMDPEERPTARHPVRTMVEAACGGLPPETARLCRLSALGGWPTVDAPLAGRAADVTREDAARMLAEAADAQLLETLGDGRFRFRPEVRHCLADDAAAQYGVPVCSAAVSRVLDALLNRALHAAHAALPQSWRTEPPPAAGDAFEMPTEGTAALLKDVGNLVRAVAVAEEYGNADTAMRLARALWPLQLKAGYWDEVLPALRFATRCADEHSPESRMAGALYFQLGHCLGELERWEEADEAVHAALASERAAGHVRGEASAVELLGLLRLGRWLYDEAYERFGEAERLYRLIAPGHEGAEDMQRALALVGRHQGRALRGMGRLEESRARLEAACDFFAEQHEPYNHARALTDLAELLHEAGEDDAALTNIARAERLLSPEEGTVGPHLDYLARLRLRCRATR